MGKPNLTRSTQGFVKELLMGLVVGVVGLNLFYFSLVTVSSILTNILENL